MPSYSQTEKLRQVMENPLGVSNVSIMFVINII